MIHSVGILSLTLIDARSKVWDFWSDCASGDELEKFAKILFGFNRKKGLTTSDPFWETSAEVVFISCVQYLIDNNRICQRRQRWR